MLAFCSYQWSGAIKDNSKWAIISASIDAKIETQISTQTSQLKDILSMWSIVRAELVLLWILAGTNPVENMSLDTMNELKQKYKNWKSYIKVRIERGMTIR